MKREAPASVPADASRLPGRLIGAGLLLGLALAAGCGSSGDEGPRSIDQVRVREASAPSLGAGASTAERFGFGGAERSAPTAGPAYTFDLPPGWSELPPAQFRTVNLRVAGDERAECYLTELGGGGGGLEANVDRWRSQLGLPPATPDEIAALPSVSFLGGTARMLVLQGTKEGQSEPWGLYGLLQFAAGRATFLKMSGPWDVIEAQRDAFLALAGSFRRGGAPATSPSSGAAPPAGGGADSMQGGGFAWEAPAGWHRAPDRPMRLVTYTAGDAGEVECYATLLGGNGGGARPNVDRWCRQMGRPVLTDEEWAALEHAPLLGTDDAILVELEGTYAGMSGKSVPDAVLLGAIGELPGRALFVKLIGPRDAALAQREAFRAFCRSLAPQE